jgi:electron transfer flavoprotein alpha subunit
MAREILVLVEQAGGKVDSVTLQLLTAGRQLATQLNTGLAALVIGHQLDSVVIALKDSGADKILRFDDPALADAAGEAQAHVIAQIARQIEARYLLIGYSLVGMELAPAIATLLGINAFTNCVNVEMREGVVTVTRPLFDGTQHAHIALEENESAVIALQKGAFAPLAPSTNGAAVETVAIDSKNLPARSKVLAIIEEPTGGVDIGKAEIIVSIGRGVGNEDKIPILAELAEALGGVLACSRPVVDVGWLPRERQVGASGKTVTPKVYLACGISGAIQHLTGMRDSHQIIAINKDPNAPIFGVAHFGVVGDLFEIVPALTRAAKEAKAERD